VGIAGPGVGRNGVVGPTPQQSPTTTAAGQNGLPTLTVPAASGPGLWVEETDIRPTLLSLVGLKDDYRSDGVVLSGIMAHQPNGVPFADVAELADTSRQLIRSGRSRPTRTGSDRHPASDPVPSLPAPAPSMTTPPGSRAPRTTRARAGTVRGRRTTIRLDAATTPTRRAGASRGCPGTGAPRGGTGPNTRTRTSLAAGPPVQADFGYGRIERRQDRTR
jgi:hypothetical protein